MANKPDLSRDLLNVLSKHGVTKNIPETKAPPIQQPVGQVASYIKEIISGDTEFDEDMLSRVVNVLKCE
jgi:hypothetical protein